MKYSKVDKEMIALTLASQSICKYSKAAPQILRLAASQAKDILKTTNRKQAAIKPPQCIKGR